MEVLRSTSRVVVKDVNVKVLSSSFLNLFSVSTCFETVSDGDELRSAVDCYALEGLPRTLAAASTSLSSRKKKGPFGNHGLKRLLGQVQSKLDRVLTGLASKPKRRRKRFGILGLAFTASGRDIGSGNEASSGHISVLDLGLDLVPDMGFVSNSAGVEVLEPVFVMGKPSSLDSDLGIGLGLVLASSEADLELTGFGSAKLAGSRSAKPASSLMIPFSSKANPGSAMPPLFDPAKASPAVVVAVGSVSLVEGLLRRGFLVSNCASSAMSEKSIESVVVSGGTSTLVEGLTDT